MKRPSTQAPEHDPSCLAASAQTGDETNAGMMQTPKDGTRPAGIVSNTIRRDWQGSQPPDFAKIRRAILSDKPGRIGFTRFSHLAFCPPYRRSAGAPDA